MTRPVRVSVLLAMFLALAAGACGDGSGDGGAGGTGNAGGSGGGGSGGGEPTPVCQDPTAVPCEDAMIQQLDFQTDPAPGLVTNDPDGAGFVSHIDATAGATGSPPTPTEGYVYARFAATGLEKVELDDETALESMDWDIAFRRYVIRINSGNSGPSCVGAARLPAGTAFETATAPDAATYHADAFYTEDCTMIGDGGMGTSPATALAGYYSYDGCVQMTGNVYVLRLANGHTVKLTVTGYYGPEEKQQYCEEHGTPATPSGAANFSVRWAFLE